MLLIKWNIEKRIEDLSKKFYWTVSSAFTNLFYQSFYYIIPTNAGLEGAVVVNKVKESEPGFGFNALTEEYVDMVKDGILDPAFVAARASSIRNFFSFISVSVAAPTRITATPPDNFASLS